MADNKRGRGDRDENQENRNECKSAKAIKLLREVTSLLSEGDSEPYQPAPEQISQAHGQVGASGIVQNFRKLFAPYSVHNSTPLSSSRQTKRNYPKRNYFSQKKRGHTSSSVWLRKTSPELQQEQPNSPYNRLAWADEKSAFITKQSSLSFGKS